MQHEAADGPTLASYDVTTLASVSVIWCLVALNFYVLAVRRHAQQAWNWLSLLVGYGGLALQALSFYRCRHTNPGTVTDEWVAAATAGTVPASVCPRSGKLVPPGGLYVRRAGESVILGFDHYCFWLGAPVGLRNRRHLTLTLTLTLTPTLTLATLALALALALALTLPLTLTLTR